jgi:hypothetical protein
VGLLLALLLPLVGLLSLPAVAAAAEVLQVREATLLQLGDGNRSYSVRLACVAVAAADAPAAVEWMRRQLPRHTRLNLRPIGNDDGVLVARLQRLDAATDLSDGLIAAGLAQPAGCS